MKKIVIFSTIILNTINLSYAYDVNNAYEVGTNFIAKSTVVDGVTQNGLNLHNELFNYKNDVSYLHNNLIQSLYGIKLESIDLFEAAQLYLNYKHALDLQLKLENFNHIETPTEQLESVLSNYLTAPNTYSRERFLQLAGDYVDDHNNAMSEWPSLLDYFVSSAKQLSDSAVAGYNISRATFLDYEKIKYLIELGEIKSDYDKIAAVFKNIDIIYSNIKILFKIISEGKTPSQSVDGVLNKIQTTLNVIEGLDSAKNVVNAIVNVRDILNRIKYISSQHNFLTPDDLSYIINIAQAQLKNNLMANFDTIFNEIGDVLKIGSQVKAITSTRKAFDNAKIYTLEAKLKHGIKIRENGLSFLSKGLKSFKTIQINFAKDLGLAIINNPHLKKDIFKENSTIVNDNDIKPDTTPPNLIIGSDRVIISQYYNQKHTLEIPSVSAIDSRDGNLPTSYTLSSPMPWSIGVHKILFSAIDSAGNGITKTQNITINPPQNAVKFISEEIADNTEFNAGDTFIKKWTLQNVGSNTWDSSYCLQHYNGDYLGDNSSVCVDGTVVSGQNYTFSVPMTAPNATSSDATYTEYWKLAKDGKPFSGSIWAKIIVKGLEKPALTVGLQTENSIEVNWNKPNGVNYYRLFMGLSENGYFQPMYSGTDSKTTVKNLDANTLYYFKIKSCVSENSCSNYSDAYGFMTDRTQGDASKLVQNFNISNDTVKQGENINLSAIVFNDGNIAYNNKFRFYFTLNNNAIYSSGDERFYLPVKQSENFKYQYNIPDDIATGDYQLSACTTYFKSANNQNHDFYCQDLTLTINELPVDIPDTANKLNISFYESANNGDRLFISWNDNAEFYRLYRSNSVNGTYNEIYSGLNNGHNDKNISENNKYFYKLKSCQTSLINTCSDFSTVFSGVASSSYETDAEDDFYVTWSGLSGNTANVSHRYKGTRETLVDDVKVGIYLSSDNICTTNDDFLGSATSGLNKNDIVDSESINITLPSKSNSGTWYLCAIADYDNTYNEIDENNNASYIILEDGSEDTLDPNAPDVKLSLSYDDKRDTFGISWRSRLLTADFKLLYSYDGNNYTTIDYIDGTKGTQQGILAQQISGSTDNNKIYFKVRFTGLDPDVGGYPNYYKIFNLSYTPITINRSPKVEVINNTTVLIDWNNIADLCNENYYGVIRSDHWEPIYLGSNTKFVDYFAKPNSKYTYKISCAKNIDDYYNNDFYYTSNASESITTPINLQIDTNWKKIDNSKLPTKLTNRSKYGFINFNNKLWIIGGNELSTSFNDVWSSIDGENWVLEKDFAEFSPRFSPKLVVKNNELFLIGGIANNNTEYNKEIWKSNDGVNWVIVNNNTPFNSKTITKAISFNNNIFVFGSYDSKIYKTSDGVSWEEHYIPIFDNIGEYDVFISNDKLILIGGRKKHIIQYDRIVYPTNKKIFSSANGINWNIENTEFDVRSFGLQVVKFGDYYYIIGGNKAYHTTTWSKSSNYKAVVQLTSDITPSDIYKSKDGVNWKVVSYNNGLLRDKAKNIALVFNNKIIAGTIDNLYYADYGYTPPYPESRPLINTNNIKQQILSVDLSNFVDDRGINNISYQWYKDDEAIVNATNASLTITSFATGSKITAHIAYTNNNGDYHKVLSDGFIIPINESRSIVFENNKLITGYTQQMTQNLIGIETGDNVVFSSSNPQVASVSGSNASVTITVNAIGSTTISAKITTSDNKIFNTSMNLVIYKSNANISFDKDLSYHNMVNGDLQLTLNNPHNLPITYISDNENIATVDENGVMKLYQTGKVKITAITNESNFYLAGSTSIEIVVNNTDYDGDLISDSLDNCPYTYNPEQTDDNQNGIGNACDNTNQFSLKITNNPYADIYIDGVKCDNDSCINNFDENSVVVLTAIITNNDYEFSSWSDGCGNNKSTNITISSNISCSLVINPIDTDNDGIPNFRDTDDDNDGLSDEFELQNNLNPLVSNLKTLTFNEGYSLVGANINTTSLKNNEDIDIIWSLNDLNPYFAGYSPKYNDALRKAHYRILTQVFDNEATFIRANKDTTLEVLDTKLDMGGVNAVARINYSLDKYKQGLHFYGTGNYIDISAMTCYDDSGVDMVAKLNNNEWNFWTQNEQNYYQVEPNEGFVVWCK
jgi:hypothetical protein